MKVLIVTQYYYPEPFKISDICEELVKRGNEVTVLTGIPNYPMGEYYSGYLNKKIEEKINGVRVIRTKLRPRKKGAVNLFLNYLSFWFQSAKCARRIKEKFDIVYAWQLSPVFYVSSAHKYCKKNNVKLICYCMDLWPESLKAGGIRENSLVFKFFKYVSKKIYNYADEIVVSSPSFEKYLRDVIEYKKEISFLPQHYVPKFKISDKRIMKRNDKPVFLYAGNIGSVQQIDRIIMAFSEIDAELYICGNGSRYSECLDIVSKYNINNVHLTGLLNVDELRTMYELADFCVLPLSNESYIGKTIPAKMQEYFYYEKPILAAIDGDAKVIITDLGNGVVCDLNDLQSISESAKKMITKKEEYKEKSRNAKIYFDDNYSLKKHVDNLILKLEKFV